MSQQQATHYSVKTDFGSDLIDRGQRTAKHRRRGADTQAMVDRVQAGERRNPGLIRLYCPIMGPRRLWVVLAFAVVAASCAADGAGPGAEQTSTTQPSTSLVTTSIPNQSDTDDYEVVVGSVGDPDNPIDILENGSTFDPLWNAEISLACGPDADSRVISSFVAETNDRGTPTVYMATPSSGGMALSPVAVESVVPKDVVLAWAIDGILLGPWEIDRMTDLCDDVESEIDTPNDWSVPTPLTSEERAANPLLRAMTPWNELVPESVGSVQIAVSRHRLVDETGDPVPSDDAEYVDRTMTVWALHGDVQPVVYMVSGTRSYIHPEGGFSTTCDIARGFLFPGTTSAFRFSGEGDPGIYKDQFFFGDHFCGTDDLSVLPFLN